MQQIRGGMLLHVHGGSPSSKQGADIIGFNLGTVLLLEPVTARGQAFVKKNKSLFRDPSAKELQKRRETGSGCCRTNTRCCRATGSRSAFRKIRSCLLGKHRGDVPELWCMYIFMPHLSLFRFQRPHKARCRKQAARPRRVHVRLLCPRGGRAIIRAARRVSACVSA